MTKKDAKFKWTSACQKSFELLKETLCGEPVLKYADTSKPYTLYTDASKYGWAGVLTQPHITTINGKSTTTDHPVAFVSGLFRGSQLNWAALTKEAFAIYMSIKKLLFYLTDAQILLRSDHKPLEKFLLKNTLNSKVNSWAMELEAFNIQFDYSLNPETNRKGMKISHSFQAITISVCSVQEIIRLRIVHNNDRPHPLTTLLVVQVLLYTKMHLAPHAPLFILIHNHQPHTVSLHCMYRHQLLT